MGSILGPANRDLIERWLHRLHYKLTSPQFLISLLLLAALAFLLLQPLWELISRTLTWGERDFRLSRDAIPGEATLFHWKHMLFSPSAKSVLLEPLVNTLVTGSSAAALALALGSILAWLIVRTDMPGRRWLRPILTLSYVVPSFALALAWGTLFRSSKIGGVAGFFESNTGIVPPDWLPFGPVPIIIVMTIHYFPFAFLLVSGALATVDTQLVESAELLGASRWTILRRIIFPLVTPALLAAFVLIFGKTIGTFALPFLLGAPVRYHTLPTILFSSLKLGMEARAYIFALVLILITGAIVYLNYRILGGASRRFETIGGKGFKANPTLLGLWRWPAFTFVSVVALATGIIPIGLMVYRTLMLLDGRYGVDNFTLHYWIGTSNPEIAHGQPGVLHNSLILGAAWNSIRLAVLSSASCGVVGLVIGYIVVRNRGSWISRLLDQISFVPFLFPAIALGAMYLSMFAVQHGPIPALYGTFTLLVLIAAVDKLPYSTRTGASAVTQIGQELEEAAEIQGISWFKRFHKIVLPLATSGLAAGMMVSFVSIMRELSLIIFLITPSTGVLMTLGFRYAEEGQPQLANALVLLVTFITIVGELIIWRVGKGRLARLQEK
jgi:iron(III) transport system permease protein